MHYGAEFSVAVDTVHEMFCGTNSPFGGRFLQEHREVANDWANRPVYEEKRS